MDGGSVYGKRCHIEEPNNYNPRFSLCMAINKDKIISYRFTKVLLMEENLEII